MPTLVVVACGTAKVWKRYPKTGPTKAAYAYVGPPFKVNKEYALRFGDDWVILSAKYGFIHPDFLIPANYNVSFSNPATNPISVVELKRMAKELGGFDKVVVLGSERYAQVTAAAFAESKANVFTPLVGLPIGIMMGTVKRAILSGTPLDC